MSNDYSDHSLPYQELQLSSFSSFSSKGNLSSIVPTFPVPESTHSRILVDHLARRDAKFIDNASVKTGRLLGRGAFMSVHEATLNEEDKIPIKVAVKSIAEDSLPGKPDQGLGKADEAFKERMARYREAVRSMLFEVDITSHDPLCRHRNIVRLLGVLLDSSEEHVNLQNKPVILPRFVVELASCDLAHYHQKIFSSSIPSHQMTARFIADIADGLSTLHAYGIVHADLKPGNILIFRDSQTTLVAKVADFGVCGIGIQKRDGGLGTRKWNPPECLGETGEDLEVRTHLLRDIYAYGLIVGYLTLDGRFHLRTPLISTP